MHMTKGKIFLLFMGWFIFYSLLYFLSLDITGDPPGKEGTGFHKVFNYGILFIISIPGWWFSWKKFQTVFFPAVPVGGERMQCRFGLRNPELMYYLMFLKLFLLAMGANGIITLSHHTGAGRTFFIWNFIILYIYAIPFFIIKFIKLKKALSSEVVLDETAVSLRCHEQTIVQINYPAISQVLIEEGTGAAIVKGDTGTICLGSKTSKFSPFYIAGLEKAVEKICKKAPDKISPVASLKDELKKLAIKPFL
jgi:hypothetical protein